MRGWILLSSKTRGLARAMKDVLLSQNLVSFTLFDVLSIKVIIFIDCFAATVTLCWLILFVSFKGHLQQYFEMDMLTETIIILVPHDPKQTWDYRHTLHAR